MLEYYQKALRISEEVPGLDHPSTAAICNNLAGIYEIMGDDAKALEYYQIALNVLEASLGSEHPDVRIVLENFHKAITSFINKENSLKDLNIDLARWIKEKAAEATDD